MAGEFAHAPVRRTDLAAGHPLAGGRVEGQRDQAAAVQHTPQPRDVVLGDLWLLVRLALGAGDLPELGVGLGEDDLDRPGDPRHQRACRSGSAAAVRR
ncbi:hypothetical protein OG417_41990 [Actinoallomurus sp. NBC_01490]|uniref:hypothetical protein n=1 Tax=Actinoallomurus sp. NBC_01490 TaxID=2903557 RepID=UPI002E36F826|nr:hypothetical protein [Actinoallomurus sp. NBC_01490]